MIKIRGKNKPVKEYLISDGGGNRNNYKYKLAKKKQIESEKNVLIY